VNLVGALECILFVAGEPLPLAEMARALQCDPLAAEEALRELQLELGERNSGLQVVSIAGGYQLSTRQEHAEVVARLLARGSNKLSRAALETLAIIAYRQPITQPEIEGVRGVAVGGLLKNLVDKKLIAEAGRKQTVGRPILYTTTPEFLHYFAIADLSELPPLGPDEIVAAPAPDPNRNGSSTDEPPPPLTESGPE
jgi:segregation and condensation protein B